LHNFPAGRCRTRTSLGLSECPLMAGYVAEVAKWAVLMDAALSHGLWRRLRLLERQLQAVELAVRKRLDAPKKRVSDVYFLVTGLATVVTNGEPPIEVGMIGRNPMSDLSVVLDGAHRTIHEAFMQIDGSGRCMSVNKCPQRLASGPTALCARLHDSNDPDSASAAARSRSGRPAGC
jgi:hypothetical protein